MKKWILLATLILSLAKAEAQFKLIANCRYYHDSTGYYLHDSTHYFYAAPNGTSCIQDLTDGWVNAIADSMNAFSRNDTTFAMDKHTRTLWTYDAAYDKKLSETYYYYNNFVLQFDGGSTHFWSGNQLDSVLGLITHYPGGVTVDNYRTYNHYNGAGLRDTSWNVYYTAAGAFSLLRKYSYSYYPNNLQDESYDWESLDSLNYVVKNRTKRYYDANNNLDSTIGYLWNAGQWYKIYKHEFKYSAANLKTSYEIFNLNQAQQTWVPGSKTIYMRTNGTEINTIIDMLWNQGASQYDSASKAELQYTNGFLTKRYSYNYDGLQNQWIPNPYGALHEFHYDQIPNSIHEQISQENSLIVFPNPAHEQISFDAGERKCMFSISGLDGKVYVRGTAEGQSTVDIKSLANGMYIITLQQGSNKLSNTFLKQ